MLPEVVAAVRNLEVGATAGPVKTSQGFHYVKLLERKVAPTPTFEQAREQLKAALRARRAQELEQAYLAAIDTRL
jgi:foldase protein PrsA